ncbi:MAG: LIC12048 family lipoprotein [Spirochaetota bacterium]|nr:LIC12048 family lipoprotein [Spirochaetota bacterium]
MKILQSFFLFFIKTTVGTFIYLQNRRDLGIRIATLMLVMCLPFYLSCKNSGDTDLSNTQHLIAEPVNTEPEGDDPAGDPEEGPPVDDLFKLAPNEWTPLRSVGGAVDPVGTTLPDDFDGDGLANDKETTTNIWVADYPVIETNVAPPVTMKIEILETGHTESVEISSEITSDDTVKTRDASTENIHRDELNTRTVQYQDSYNESSSDSSSSSESESSEKHKSGQGSVLWGLASGGGSKGSSSSSSSSVSESHSEAYGETTTKWADKPFKDNLNRNGNALKTNEASKNARQMRSEIREKVTTTYEVTPNAGYVRAALYIHNYSVNMPVKLTNILCSFMFETFEGQLIPVQSFRLRNDDYSFFSIEIYGNDTVGPYVIELSNLNTNEIKEAIAKGYNPKIFIIDYEMTHVADSNYKLALGESFTGDNLKIIEENAKGRTAGIKFIGPGMREFFRVAAFDTDGNESRNSAQGVENVSPGVSLEKALRRISYSGISIEFAYYIIDATCMIPEMSEPRFLVRTVKSVGGIETRMPAALDAFGNPYTVTYNGETVFVTKPICEWENEDFLNFRRWVPLSQAKYYFHAADVLDENFENDPERYNYTDADGITWSIPVIEGIKSIIWPGDHYDLVCLDMSEYLNSARGFGGNPIDRGSAINFNTSWDLADLGEYPFYPDIRSVYLGEAGLGDTLEFIIKLNSTKYLNPDFGAPEVTVNADIYTDFAYNIENSKKNFYIDEAVDFEISFGLSGEYEDWVNLFPDRSPYSLYKDDITIVDKTWDFMKQEFTFVVQLPTELDGVAEDGPVKLYMRTALNNAYRDSIWILPYSEAKKFRGEIFTDVNKGETEIKISSGMGEIAGGDILVLSTGGSNVTTYQIENVSQNDSLYIVTLSQELVEDHNHSEFVYVDLDEPLTEPEIRLSIDHTFFSDWNADNSAIPPVNPDSYIPLMVDNNPVDFTPVKDLGYDTDYIAGNWIGNNNYSNPYWNNWIDASFINGFHDQNLDPFLQTSQPSFLRLLSKNDSGFSGDDIQINSDAITNEHYPLIVASGDKALVAWDSFGDGSTSQRDIYGRVVDLSGDQPVLSGDEIPICTRSGYQSQKQIAISESDTALAVWSDDYGVADFVWGSTNNFKNIHGRLVDVSTGELVGESDFVINTHTTTHPVENVQLGASLPQLAISGDKALVVWQHLDCSSWFVYPFPINLTFALTLHNDVYGRIVDTSTGTPIGAADFLIHRGSDHELGVIPGSVYPQIVTDGDQALVIWNVGRSIHGCIVDMSSGTPVVGDLLSISSSNYAHTNMKLSASDGMALVIWQDNRTGEYDIRGRLVDISTGDTQGAGDFLISTHNSIQGSPQLATSGEDALVVWDTYYSGRYHIYGRFVDMSTGTPSGTSDFPISTNSARNHNLPKLAISGNRALVTWRFEDSNGYHDVRGRLVDISSKVPLGGSDFLINTNTDYHQRSLNLAISGGKALVVWNSDHLKDSGHQRDIMGRMADMNELDNFMKGFCNFFTAPLIERNYEVQVRIKE